MAEFTLYNENNAPEGSKALLEDSKKSFGMVPNLHAVFAESPQALEAYKTLTKLFSQSSLTTTERHLVWLTINVENKCHYCVPAHTMLAKNDKVDDAIIEAARNDQPVADAKLEALRQFTKKMVVNRGFLPEEEVQAFLDAGYTNKTILDIILGMAHKTLSNYTNHMAHTPVDEPFKQFAWEAQEA